MKQFGAIFLAILLVLSAIAVVPANIGGNSNDSEDTQQDYEHLEYEPLTEDDVDVVVSSMDDLQTAINNSEGDETIGVETDEYYDGFQVGDVVDDDGPENLTIVSMEPQGAEIDLDAETTAIEVYEDNTTIKGFSLVGLFPDESTGIEVDADDVSITNNYIGEFETSIRLMGGEGIEVLHNTLDIFKTGVDSDVTATVNNNNIYTDFEYFQVNIYDYTEAVPSDGDVFEVDYRVANLGELEDTQTLTYIVEDSEGTVVDEVTEEVTLESGEFVEDTFEWDPSGEDAGTYEIFIATEDYEDWTGDLHYQEYQVTFDEQNDVENADISVYSDEALTDEVASGETDEDGEFTTDYLPDGEYWFTADRFEYEEYEGSFTIDGEHETVDFTMKDYPGDSVTFSVDDDTGGSIEDATITIEDSEGEEFAELETNEDGEAYVELPEGDYTYVVSHEDYYTETGELTAEEGTSTEEISMEAIPEDVNTVFWPYKNCTPNEVIEDVEIKIYNDSDRDDLVETLETDENGASTTLDADEEYFYNATIFGWEDESGSFTTPESGDEDYHFEYIEMTRQNAIFEVLDLETGEPLANAELEIYDNVDHVGEPVETVTTDSDGLAAFYLEPGEYSLNATKAGYIGLEYHTFTVVEGEVYDETLELEPDLVEVEFYAYEAGDVTEPLEDVEINVENESTGMDETKNTDEYGTALFVVTDGWDYNYTADKYLYSRVEDNFTASDGGEIEVPMEPSEGENVTFNVTWSGVSTISGEEPDIDEGDGIGNATVEVYTDEKMEDLAAEGVTEWEGEDTGNLTLNISYLPNTDEEYYVSVDHPDYIENNSVNFTHTQDDPAEVVDIQLDYLADTYEVEFFVYEDLPPAENPVEDVNITIYQDEDRTEQFRDPIFTDEDGYASMDIPEGDFYLNATKDGYWDPDTEEMTYQTDFTVDANDNNTEQFRMEEFPGYDVTFTALNGETLDPIEGIDIDVDGTVLTTNETGEAVDQFMDGEYSYTASDPEDQPEFEDYDGEFTVDGEAVEVEFEMEPIVYNYTVRFWPHDSEGDPGEALEGIEIENETGVFGPLETDENGATAELEPGEYNFTANRHDYIKKNVTFEFEAPSDPDYETKVIFAMERDDMYKVDFEELNGLEGVYITMVPMKEPTMEYDTTTDEYGEASEWIPSGEYWINATIEGGVFEDHMDTFTVEETEDEDPDPQWYDFEMMIETAPFLGVEYTGDDELDAKFNYWDTMDPADVIEDSDEVLYIPWYDEPLPTEDIYNAYIEEFSTITGARTISVHFTRGVQVIDTYDPVTTRALESDDFEISDEDLDVDNVDHEKGDDLAILELSKPITDDEFGDLTIDITGDVVDDDELPAWEGEESLSDEGKLPVTSGWNSISFPRETTDDFDIWEDETRDAIETMHVWDIDDSKWESNPEDPMDVNDVESFSVIVVKTEIATEIEVEFKEPGPQDIPPTQELKAGWNLVGANLNVHTEEDANIYVNQWLASVDGYWSTVSSPELNIGEAWTQTHYQELMVNGDADKVDGFQGYWVYMNENAELAGRTT